MVVEPCRPRYYFGELNRAKNDLLCCWIADILGESPGQLRENEGMLERQRNVMLLWIEQNGIDLYSGKDIDLRDALSIVSNFREDTCFPNGTVYEVDHIIPQGMSRCLAGRFENKVLSSRECNQLKGERTPRQWIEDTWAGRDACSRAFGHVPTWEDFVARVRMTDTLPAEKRRFLLCEKPAQPVRAPCTASLS